MKIDSIRRISREDLEGAPDEEWIDKLLDPVNSTSENVVQALRGNLGFTDNTNSGFKEVDLVHDTETRISNPLKVRPTGIVAVRALKLSSNQPTGVSLENPRIKWRMADNGDVFVTPSFECRHTEPLLVKRLASAKSIPSTVLSETLIDTWQTDANAEVNRGGVIRESAGTFTVSEPGTYQVAAQLSLDVGTYTTAQLNVVLGNGRRYLSYLAMAHTDGPWLPVSAIFSMTASDTLQIKAVQANAAAANRNAITGSGSTRVAVSRLYNSTIYSARTTLFFFGD